MDAPELAGIAVRALPLYMTDLPATVGHRPGRPGPGRGAGRMSGAEPAGPGLAGPGVTVAGLPGLPEIAPGADLAGLIAAAAPELADGDIVVITSKIVSKAEGRVIRADREKAIDGETVRVVARRGPTRIVETRHGLVLAAAGVDDSNTAPGTVVLLPEDPDGSARRIRAGLRERRGVRVGVVITDTMGRPWRIGQTDAAIGAAGLAPLRDHRGQAGHVRHPDGGDARRRGRRDGVRRRPGQGQDHAGSRWRSSGAWPSWSPRTTGRARRR